MSQAGEQKENQAPFSLINYEAEIQITDNIDEYQKAKNAAKKLDPNPSPQDVLNNMITPRDWRTDGNKYFMQYVSHSKSSRDDVFKLKQSLQQALQYRQARKEGICAVRQQLFSQAFNQMTRQVTINCPERGLLLMRVRDQHKMSLAAYQTLYKSSVEYGMKKQLQSQQGMQQLQNQLREAQNQFNQFNQRRIQLECKKQSLEKNLYERKQIQSGEREQQLNLIGQQAQNLQLFLATIGQQKLKQTNLTGPSAINKAVDKKN